MSPDDHDKPIERRALGDAWSPVREPPPQGDPRQGRPALDGAARRVRLKGNVKRTVELETGSPSGPLLIKRFHAPGLGAFRDGARARREARALRTAAARGLPVPRVDSVARRNGHWELQLQFLTGARPLDEVLLENGVRRRVALARRLGTLLAALEVQGFLHPDPHPGNVLVDPAGQVWLVDLARVRFGAPARAVLDSLVVATARLREASTPSFRAAVHRAWKRSGGRGFGDPAAVERRARAIRVREIAGRVAVWCRTSSATEVASDSSGRRRTWVRALKGHGPDTGWETRTLHGSRAECLAAWDTLVRATLHGIPCVRARSMTLAAPHAVEFDTPIGASETRLADLRVRERLRSRGLRLDPARLLVDASGRTWLDATARLVAAEDGAGGEGGAAPEPR